ncbi:MAG: InlB B-repeat-containing protein [Clostridia bacterium]|nr:InlB B-repeat-containing protein [Clostridia bacterium]
MKKSLLIILALTLCLCAFAIASCSDPEIEGLTFESVDAVYDGTEKTIEVSGLPEGATVTYSPQNTFKEAGEHVVTATVKQDGFADTTLTATLKILPKTVTVTYENLVFKASGSAPKAVKYTVNGVLEGDSVELEFDFGACDFSEEGDEGTLTAKSKNPNYTLNSNSVTKKFTVGPNEHTVKFETGVQGQTVEDQQVSDGIKAREPRKIINNGYEFIGWFLGDVQWDFTKDKVTDDILLVAKWQANVYSIIYNLDGGTNSPDNPTEFAFDQGFSLAPATKDGAIFLGWYEDAAFTSPAEIVEPKTLRKSISYYAKWGYGYKEIIEEAPSAIGTASDFDGSFRYTLSLNIESFAENGTIYFGRGKDTLNGSYIKITSEKVLVYTNGAENQIVSSERTHARDMIGYIVVDVQAKAGTANVTIQTAEGKSPIIEFTWSGKSGEIFYETEGVTVMDATLGWSTEVYETKVWAVGDNVNVSNEKTWANRLVASQIVDMSSISVDSTTAIDVLRREFETAVPKYVIWSYEDESGEAYEANVAAFLALCAEFQVTPILTTHSPLISSANEAKNAAVKAGTARYIDFADAAEGTDCVENGEYTELGIVTAMAKALSDVPEMITPEIPIKHGTAEKLDAQNPTISLGNNRVKDEKYFVFSAKIDGTLTADQKILLGHGYMVSYGRWFELTGNTLSLCSYTSWNEPDKQLSVTSREHGIEIKNFITVIITADKNNTTKTSFTIITDGATYTYKGYGYSACEGEIFVTAQGLEMTDVTLDWACKAYDADIWIIGASYLSLNDPARWPEYYYNQGYNGALLVGRGGMGNQHAIEDFKDALKHGKPKYLVWDSAAGNNPDEKLSKPEEWGTVNETFLVHMIEVMDICKEEGIELIIELLPNCVNQNNYMKNEMLMKKQGQFANYDYKLIDVAKCLGAHDRFSNWYEGMLYTDNVHPTRLGAIAYYMQMINTFPELMRKTDAEIYKSEVGKNVSGNNAVNVSVPNELCESKIFTLSADFAGSLMGSIELSTGKANGGTYMVIDKNNINVYRNVNGEEVLVTTIANPLKTENILNVKVHVTGCSATVTMMSVGFKDTSDIKLFTFDTEWVVAGELAVSTNSQTLTEAFATFFTE